MRITTSNRKIFVTIVGVLCCFVILSLLSKSQNDRELYQVTSNIDLDIIDGGVTEPDWNKENEGVTESDLNKENEGVTESDLNKENEGVTEPDLNKENVGGKKLDSINETKFILINAYMRSGSTFLGGLLGHQEKIFYYYEPLHRMIGWHYTNGTKLCKHITPICEERPDARDRVLEYLGDLFNCTLRPHEDKFIEGLHTMEQLAGSKWKDYRTCRKDPSSTIQSCLGFMENECRKYQYRSMKVLRMSLSDASLLLDRLPNLKIVHLFRDPRAIINSHLYTEFYASHSKNFEEDVKANCHRIESDVIAALKLTKQYPDRLMVVQYEDLYGNFDNFEKVYNFTGMTVTAEVKRFLQLESSHQFSGSKNVEGQDHRFKYRGILSFETVKLIDKYCAKAVQLLGLRTYSSEAQLKDYNVDPVINALPFAIE